MKKKAEWLKPTVGIDWTTLEGCTIAGIRCLFAENRAAIMVMARVIDPDGSLRNVQLYEFPQGPDST